MPMMPFIGVRISWLMLARNSLLAVLADSASPASWLARLMARSSCRFAASVSSFDRRSSSSAARRSLMSRQKATS